MMEDLSDFGTGAILKQLDDLDAKHYSPQSHLSDWGSSKMTTSQDQENSNVSDFDNSDEDLASLLGDDDDDIFAKKIYGGSPAKKDKLEKSTPASTKKDSDLIASSKVFADTPSNKTKSPIKQGSSPKDDLVDDILDDFIDSSATKNSAFDSAFSTTKNKSKPSSFSDDEDDFLEDLNQFSPSRDLPDDSPLQSLQNKFVDQTADVLDTADKSVSKHSKERRGSFFDDFLQKLSPKRDAAKNTDIGKQFEKDEENEDILGAYMPTTQKKNETTVDAVSKSPKKKGSLLKQVSFKDLPENFSDTLVNEAKNASPPTSALGSKKKSISEPEKSDKINIVSKKTEKKQTSKSDDMDWENFFKESPKKQPNKKNESSELRKDLMPVNKQKPTMRRQSSADWLGLSEPKIPDDSTLENKKEVKDDEINFANIKQTRPNTSDAGKRSRRQTIGRNIDEWDDGSDFRSNINPSLKSDLSDILKDDTKNKFGMDTSKTIPTGPSRISPVTSKEKHSSQAVQKTPNALTDSFVPDQVISSSDSALEIGFDVSPTKKMHLQSVDQTAAINSMQLLLDNSIQERNKLMKENEAIKLTYEEKIKMIEELHKTEKKSYEDLYQTLESSLKKEFEIKVKSLEEKLNIISLEKAKQENNFKERLENVLKEHEVEMQRLKELHSQSINIMKDDHEDALSRLKRLKEQEVEAVLSTQVHSKSLKHLSDQLEMRAHELALLQNKVEERNQSTLREKQVLLDAREKDLKALQNRLQRQLEDGEEERTRLQQLVLRLEGRLQKVNTEGEEDHWEVQRMKAKLTVQQKYLEEEQKLNQHQLEKEKEKLRISQDSLLHEQKIVLVQLAQERQQLFQEKIDLQSLAKSIKEEEMKLNVKKVKEESYIESQKQFLQEEGNKLHFEKEKVKQERFILETERDALQKEKQLMRSEKDSLRQLESDLKRKSSEIEELTAVAMQEQHRVQREHAEALSIKKDQQLKMQQYTQQMQMLMDKERQILLEKEKLIAEKMEFEQTKNSVLCTKCKIFFENPVQVPSAELSMPVVFPLPNINGFTNQVQHSYMDPNLVIWHIAAQKDREFLQQELAFLQSLKQSEIMKHSK